MPQGSILRPLLFLIFINELSDNLSITAKFFADDTCLFSIVQNINTTASHLNSDLSKISSWAFRWKMSFNPEPSKQAQEVFFSRKIQKPCNFPIYLNNKLVKQVPSQKHLGMISHNKLNFQEHLKNTLNKVNKLLPNYGNYKTFCHVDHYYKPFTNGSSNLILITVMLFMINTIIILSTKN